LIRSNVQISSESTTTHKRHSEATQKEEGLDEATASAALQV
jgi:hypothetical protein